MMSVRLTETEQAACLELVRVGRFRSVSDLVRYGLSGVFHECKIKKTTLSRIAQERLDSPGRRRRQPTMFPK